MVSAKEEQSMSREFLCLGIEGTAEKLGVGIVSAEGEILANLVRQMKVAEGIHPSEAAQHHATHLPALVRAGLERAGVEMRELSLIAFSRGPGLGPCLRVAAVAARALALKHKLPLLGVNHCVAHIEIGRLTTGAEDPLTVYVSGGNTQVTAFAQGRYRVLGETIDIALGNCIDQFARELELGMPGGPVVERLARRGRYLPLPYVVKGMDLSYSGLLTAAVRLAERERVEDVCFSLQETAFAMLVEVAERALVQAEKEEVLIAGGVGVNARLQQMLAGMCSEHGVRLHVPPGEVLGDNGAMIAWLGVLSYLSGERQRLEDTHVRQRWRTDEVAVRWR